jgi:hypothetical protein
MTGGQFANGVGSFLAMITSGAFILVWTWYGTWWRTSTGRFMVMKAAAICFAGVITVWLTLTGFKPDVDSLRYIQAGIWAAVSVAFVHHTRMVWKINRKKKVDDD